MTRLVFLDTETTGLDSDRHDIWELGMIVRGENGQDVEHLWHLHPDMSKADPTGLRVGRFYERFRSFSSQAVKLVGPHVVAPLSYPFSEVAHTVATYLDGAHLVGAVPDFDARFLTRFLRRNGQAPTWHYHLIDVEALTVGWLAGAGTPIPPPWDSRAIAAGLGVQQSEDEKHTALGDARFCRDVYDRVMSS